MGAINCKEIAQECCDNLKTIVKENNLKPILTIYTMGDDDASKVYVRNKMKKAEEIGIKCANEKIKTIDKETICFNSSFEFNEWDELSTHGKILQLPIPDGYDSAKIINQSFSSLEDVDGLTYENIGKLLTNYNGYYHIPCTAKGIAKILEKVTKIEGKNVLIINRSLLIGKPLAALLTNLNATVTLCHSKSDISKYKDIADIVVSGIATPHYFKASDFPNAQVIIDASMNRDENGKLCGDFIQDREDVLYTPVPGGVGPMTVAMLMENTVNAALMAEGR